MNQKDQNDSEIQNLQKRLQDNQITNKDAGYLFRSLNNENKRIAEEVELINEAAKQQLLVTGLLELRNWQVVAAGHHFRSIQLVSAPLKQDLDDQFLLKKTHF